MHWRLKAAIQQAVSALPPRLSYAVYYGLQRCFGDLRRQDPTELLRIGVEIWQRLRSIGVEPYDRVFFEVGTGRSLVIPLAYWLMGARRVLTVDLHPYLKDAIVMRDLAWFRAHAERARGLFGSHLRPERFKALLALAAAKPSLADVFERCSIAYHAPCDASRTGLPPHSVDFHTSYTVLEHVPPDSIVDILREGMRIITTGGLFVHRVDYSDHFAHGDRRISMVNFLRYSDADWARLAGNRYAYTNRLRHDDYLDLFRRAGHRILIADRYVDRRSLTLLSQGGLQVDHRFQATPIDVLATTGAWLISRADSLDDARDAAEGGSGGERP